MSLKTIAYWIGIPSVTGLLTLLAACFLAIRSGEHLTDIRVTFSGLPEELFQHLSVHFQSMYGGSKKASIDLDLQQFSGTQLGPVATIECVISGSFSQGLLGTSIIEVHQVNRKSDHLPTRIIKQFRGSDLVWTPLQTSDTARGAILVRMPEVDTVWPKFTATTVAINSLEPWRLAVLFVRHAVLAALGTFLTLLSLTPAPKLLTSIANATAHTGSNAIGGAQERNFLASDRLWPWLLLTGGLTALVICRDPNVFLWPSMTWEDGMFYCYFLHNSTMADLTHFNNGYLPLTQNLFSLAATALPVRVVPYVYAAFGLCFAVLQYVIFFHKYFRRFVASDAVRFCGCAAIGCIPFSSVHQISNVAYALWQQLFLLILLAASGFRCGCRIGDVILWLLMFLGIWSNPLSIAVVGTVAILCFARWRLERFWISLAAAAVFYQLLGVDSNAQKLRITSVADIFDVCIMSLVHLIKSVSVGCLGQDVYAYVLSVHTLLVTVPGFCVVLLLVILSVARRAHAAFWHILMLSCLALSAGSYIGRGDLVLDIRDSPRYAYVAASFAAMGLGMLYGFMLMNLHRIAGARFPKWFFCAALSLTTGVITSYNISSTTYSADLQNGIIVRDFFSDLNAMFALAPSQRSNLVISYQKVDEPPLVARFDEDGYLESRGD